MSDYAYGRGSGCGQLRELTLMAPRSINYSNSLEALRAAGDLYNYVHSDYRYYKPDWDMIRDAMAGERRVKEMGKTYLPGLGKNAGTSYDEYKGRAVFVNMTARTVSGLVGTLFRRQPKLVNVPDALQKQLRSITPDGAHINMLAKTVTSELTQVGRVGIMVDMDAQGSNPPYLTYYVAENILAWKTEMINGKETLTYVLLREIVDELRFLGLAGSTAPAPVAPLPALKVSASVQKPRQTRVVKMASVFDSGQTPVLRAKYRVLALEDGKYVQRVYATANVRGVEVLNEDADTITPTRNGAPLDRLPFFIVGLNGVSAKVTKSPMYDISTLNFAHYRASAQLEHGRFFTALPIYYVPVKNGAEGAEYTIGPSVVWEVPGDQKPGILEYYGTGLKELANSQAEKESHISQLGGRLMGITNDKSTQSPEVAAMTQANELSVLTNLCDSATAGLTAALQFWAWWQNAPKYEDMGMRLNRDFASSNIGAREMRAIAVLYQSGILPVEELHRVFQEAELISETTDVDDFIAMLNDPANFPGQPDVTSMHEGYPDAQGKLQWRIAKLNAKTTLEDTTTQADADKEMQKQQHSHDLKTKKMDQQHQKQQQEHQSEQTRRTMQFESRQKAKPKPAPKKGP